MLKVIMFSASLILLPRNNWSIINLAILILAGLCTPILVDKTLQVTPTALMMLDPVSFTLIILRVWLSSLILIASSSVKRAGFKPA
jgi:hypothetical protein